MIFLMLFVAAIFSFCTYFLFKKAKKNFSGTKKTTAIFLSLLIFAIGLEVTVFNLNFYNSRGNEEISLNSYLEIYKSNNNYVLSQENNTIYFPEINKELQNLHFDISGASSAKNIPVSIKLSDEANAITYSTPERELNALVEKSHYINLHASGNVSGISVSFELDENQYLLLNGVSANAKRPFEFSILRLLIVFLIALFVYLFSPSSELYKKPLSKNRFTYTSYATSLICILSCIFSILSVINPVFLGIDITSEGIEFVPIAAANHNLYDDLAKAVLENKVYIDNNDVPESLKNMSNPYDTTLRTYISQQSGDKYRWDAAYYDGHYYVYFGIVPLLIMYLPFRLIMNAPFPTVVGIIAFAVLFSIGVYLLLTLIAEKKFKNISIGSLLLMLITAIISCGLLFLVKRPDFYSIPIITGMTFSVWGIYLWLSGLYNDSLRRLRFFIGSLCMALVAGCRPQLLLLTFLAIPIFFKKYIINKEIKTKNGIIEIILLLTPYIVIASGLMYYNLIRFDSPFDFGSGYQLTTNDVTRRGFDIGRTGLGFFTYLFQPPVFTAKFPFIEKAAIETNYVGKTITENCFGGLIASTPVLWFTGLLGKAKTTLKEKKLFSYTLLLLAFGFIIVFFDTQAGGLLQRYMSDFGFIFFGAALLIIFALSDAMKTENEKTFFNTLLFFASALSIFYSFALAFSVSDVTIDTVNPTLFTYLSETVQFWL